VFGNLSDRITASFNQLRGKGRLTEADVNATVTEIRRALLEADVALPVVRAFTAAVREKAVDAARSQALNPGQQVVKIVNEELIEVLGGQTREIHWADRGPTIIMLAGLQGLEGVGEHVVDVPEQDGTGTTLVRSAGSPVPRPAGQGGRHTRTLSNS